MIRIDTESGPRLIAQATLARAAGRLVAELDSESLGIHDRNAIARACEIVYDGFAGVDAVPIRDAAGLPIDHDNLPLPTLLESIRLGAELSMASGARAALLVSIWTMRRAAALTSRLDARRRHEPDEMVRLFEINKVFHRQAELQDELRSTLGIGNDSPRTMGLVEEHPDEVDRALCVDFSWMQLSLTCVEMLVRRRRPAFADVPALPVDLRLEPDSLRSPRTLSPWPFRDEVVTLTVATQTLGASSAGEPIPAIVEADALTFTLRRRP